MSKNTAPKDIKTIGYITHRTNFGEADRIINLITPLGKFSAIAKGVRKPKSKLAGGIELFCLSEFVIHQNLNDFGILTSAKIQTCHHNLTANLSLMELASFILKKISYATEQTTSPDFFEIADQSLTALNQNVAPSIVESWFLLNLAKISGEQINLYRDINGTPLHPDQTYIWNQLENALAPQPNGNIHADEIKLMRLMLSSKLPLISRIKNIQSKIPPILYIAKAINKI